MEDLSLHQTFEKYVWRKGKWCPRRSQANLHVIVRVFPRLSPSPDDPSYEEYCRIKILLHHPFRDIQALRQDVMAPWSYLFTTCQLEQHVHSKDTLRYLEDENQQNNLEEDEDEELINEDVEAIEEADWQLYSRLFPNQPLPTFDISTLGQRPLDNAWDPEAAYQRWENIPQMAGYIADERRMTGEPQFQHDNVAIDVTTLAPEQRTIYDKFVKDYTMILSGQNVSQLKVNIDGTAGCGKTYLIRAICQTLRQMAGERGLLDPIRVLAPSGVAAFNINGQTIHSALGIPATHGLFAELGGSRLATLQQQWKGVQFVIVDEKSMLGQSLLAKIDMRLRQLCPYANDIPFGGVHIALIGDFAQLPPVGDRSLITPPSTLMNDSANLSRHGHTLYTLFTESYQLKKIHRQQGENNEQVRFCTLLEHASHGGGLSREDWEFLLTRDESQLSPQEREHFRESLCLYTTKEEVQRINLKRLLDLNCSCACIHAKHDGGPSAKWISADDAGGLEAEVVLAIGAKIMLSRNLWQTQGLVNGTLGMVEDVIWPPGASRSELPLAVLISCETYMGPTLWRTPPKPGHPEGIPIIPIPPIKSTFENEGRYMARTQLPLRLAWAVTVHKSQGLTLSDVRIGLGSREFASGLTFVALSRAKDFTGFTLVDAVNFSRVERLGGKLLQYRLADYNRRYPVLL